MILGWCAAMAGIAAAQPLSPGQWLVDLGRDYPLSPEAGLSDADAQITLLFMQAATKIESDLAASYRWQAELLAALGRAGEAREAFKQYIQRQPEDTAARLILANGELQALQTAEARRDFCLKQLQQPAHPPELISDLHFQLAEIYWNRGDYAATRQSLEASLKADPLHLVSLQRLKEMTPEVDSLQAIGELMLARIQINPADADAAATLADLFEQQGLPGPAQSVRAHVAALAEAAGAEKPKPAKPAPASQPTGTATSQAAWTQLAARWSALPKGLLDYPLHPERVLTLNISRPAAELAPAEPWRCRMELTNRGGFKISVGPGLMLEPQILCLLEARGDRLRSSGPVIHVPIPGLQLAPGRTLTLETTLEVGPIRAGMIGTPQIAQDVELTAMTNPVVGYTADGREVWKPGIGGVQGKQRFLRTAYVVENQKVRSLINSSQSPRLEERIRSTELLAMLLAEHQHLAAGRLRYPAQSIDPHTVRAVLLARNQDADWQVRARLAECMRWFVLDGPAMQQVPSLLNDSHWLVRGLAMRMLADQLREKSAAVLNTAAERDPDPWVREFSKALLTRMANAAAAAPQPPTTSSSPAK